MSTSTEQALREATAHHTAGNLAAAETIYRAILAQNPNHPQALALLGVIAHQVGRHDDAVTLISRALSLNPNDPPSHNNLGEAHRAAGRVHQAIECYRAALRLNPTYAAANNNLVDALRSLRQLEQAIAQQRTYVATAPRDPDGHNELGMLLLDEGDAAEAERSLRLALDLRPQFPAAHSNLGHALQTQWRHDEALAAFRAAADADPRTHHNLLLALNYHPRLTASQVFDEHVRWARRHADPLTQASPAAHANDRSPDRRLRVGYVSPDFREHPVGQMIEPVLRGHDHAAVEVICYDDEIRPDATTQRLRGLADAWAPVAMLTHEALAQRIRDDRIDVLVDLTGHMASNRLLAFARVPAPMQFSYLGYCNTTGMRAIGYRIGDSVTDPQDGTQPYAEQLVRLPTTFCCYAPPDDAPEIAPLAALRTRRITFGSLHTLAKLNDDVLDLWSAVLKSVPDSRLLILRHTLRGVTADRLRDAFARRGITSDRLDLRHDRPAGGHLHAYNEIDIALDTFSWSGHATTCEALWMGVPTIAYRGDRHAGRLSSTVLHAAGLADLIATSPQHYVELAQTLAADLPRLAELRRTMRQRLQASPLLDGRRVAAALEQAYRRMWRAWCERS